MDVEAGVRAAGVLRLGRRRFEPSQLLVMAVAPGIDPDPAADMAWVHAAVADGADIVEVPAVDEVSGRRVVPFVATVRDGYPELVIAVRTGRDTVAREVCAAGADLLSGTASLEVAAEFGVGVAGSLAGAARAVSAGVEPARVMVEGSPELVGSGWPVLVSLSDPDVAGDLARAAVFGWLGVRVFRVGRVSLGRVSRVRETRRALSMVSAIRGDIPPAFAVRGLA